MAKTARALGETPESVWRIRFVVSMWVCGFVGIQTISIYPWSPEYWIAQGVTFSLKHHLAWLTPFCCSVASVISGIGLFRLSRVMDKVGAIVGIVLVGWWPGFLALNWWLYFLTH